jgi:hypothetical protein
MVLYYKLLEKRYYTTLDPSIHHRSKIFASNAWYLISLTLAAAEDSTSEAFACECPIDDASKFVAIDVAVKLAGGLVSCPINWVERTVSIYAF